MGGVFGDTSCWQRPWLPDLAPAPLASRSQPCACWLASPSGLSGFLGRSQLGRGEERSNIPRDSDRPPGLIAFWNGRPPRPKTLQGPSRASRDCWGPESRHQGRESRPPHRPEAFGMGQPRPMGALSAGPAPAGPGGARALLPLTCALLSARKGALGLERPPQPVVLARV